MVRPAASIGDKWDVASRNAIPDAKTGYAAALPTMAQATIDAKAGAIVAYQASVQSAAYDQAVRAGATPGVADVAYDQRLDQIATTGFTQSQKDKLVQETLVRRHCAGLLKGVIALITGASGELAFTPSGQPDSFERFIVNQAIMKYVDRFTTNDTAATIYATLKANAANITGLEVA